MIKWFKHTFLHNWGKKVKGGDILYGPFECLNCDKLHRIYRR